MISASVFFAARQAYGDYRKAMGLTNFETILFFYSTKTLRNISDVNAIILYTVPNFDNDRKMPHMFIRDTLHCLDNSNYSNHSIFLSNLFTGYILHSFRNIYIYIFTSMYFE